MARPLLIVTTILFVGSVAFGAQPVYLKLQINGNDIEGYSRVSSMERAGSIVCLSFNYSLKTPRAEATGMTTGVRQHGPVVFTKRIDKTSPLLVKALANNEPVNSAIFRFFRKTSSGAEQHYYTIMLENAYVASISIISPDVLTVEGKARPGIEEVEIIFQTITWTFEPTGASHTDSWSGS